MKLFIDDVRPAPEGWTLAKDTEIAIRILATSPEIITHISLDYDAGSESRISDATFSPVAYFIGEKYLNDSFFADDLEVKIHSANPVGMEKLKQILQNYGIFST